MSAEQPTLRIGEVATRAGVNVSLVRYYDRIGLLPATERVSGQRRYDEAAIRRLEVLEVAKRAGFSLDEARLLLERREAGTPAFEALQELAARKLPEVEALIARARSVRFSLPLTAFAPVWT